MNEPTMTMVQSGDVSLEVRSWGPPDGETVLLLHGFPEGWLTWTTIVPHFVDAGYHVVVPNQRGYGGSSKPKDIADYRMKNLVADAIAIKRAFSRRSCFLVAHDWGGVVAWDLLKTHPEDFRAAVIVNGPAMESLAKVAARNGDQRKRSWYIYFFQIPFIPEKAISRNDFHLFRKTLFKRGERELDRPEVQSFVELWKQEGTLTAMINWYRMLPRELLSKARRKIFRGTKKGQVPTRLIWGSKDHALSEGVGLESKKHARDCEYLRYEGSTHWIPREEPSRLFQDADTFFKRFDHA